MQIELKKDVQGQFMVIRPEGADMGSYRFRMLFENSIDGLLPCMPSNIDGEETIKYNTGGKIPLSDYLREYAADDGTFDRLLRRLISIIESLQLYLIGAECILLAPEYIFASEKGDFYFAVYPEPSGSFGKNMLPLSELLISKMPHNSHRAAAIGYNLYQGCVSDSLSTAKIRKILASAQESGEKQAKSVLPVREDDGLDAFFTDEDGEIFEDPKWDTKKQSQKAGKREKPKWKIKKNSDKKKLKKSGDKDDSDGGFIEKYVLKDSALLAIWEKIRNRNKDEKPKRSSGSFLDDDEPSDEFEFVKSLISESLADNDAYDLNSDEECTVVLSKNSLSRIDADCYLIPKDIFKGENIPLLLDEYCIGKRTAGADIDIADSSVSRHHARLKRKENTYELTDLGSTNGTKVNGHQVGKDEPFALSDGDEVTFGAAAYYFHIAH